MQRIMAGFIRIQCYQMISFSHARAQWIWISESIRSPYTVVNFLYHDYSRNCLWNEEPFQIQHLFPKRISLKTYSPLLRGRRW